MSRQPVLVCSVGGSPDPVVSAIRSLRPLHVELVCTQGRHGQPGSRDLVEGAEGILARAGHPAAAHGVTLVPPDDPDTAFAICRDLLDDMRQRFAKAPLRVDYTGGTKSMSAALMLAALSLPLQGTTLQLMAGERASLDRVSGGTERPRAVPVDAILAERLLVRAAQAWKAYGYAEAELILRAPAEDLRHAEDVPEAFRQRLVQAHCLSVVLAGWDRFDHAAALRGLDALPAAARAALGSHAPALQALCDPDRREPLVLLDLWLNACRRAARGQYDDAVARCYRTVEWTAQWILRSEKHIDTACVPPAALPASFVKQKKLVEKRGGYELGLTNAWDLICDCMPAHPLVRTLRTPFQGRKPKELMEAWIGHRNRSILAHGFQPVSPATWKEVETWMRRHWLPWAERTVAHGETPLAQLPTALP